MLMSTLEYTYVLLFFVAFLLSSCIQSGILVALTPSSSGSIIAHAYATNDIL